MPAAPTRHMFVWGSVTFFNIAYVTIEGRFFAPNLEQDSMIVLLLVTSSSITCDECVGNLSWRGAQGKEEALHPILDRALDDEWADALRVPIGKGELAYRKF